MAVVMDDVAVVVATHNRAERLPRLIRALEAQELRPREVVIVDDGSSDDTTAVLQRLASATDLQLRCISQPQSQGPAVARNAGWRATSAPFVAFTDDDCEPSKQWLRESLAVLRGGDDIGIVQGRVRPDPSGDLSDWPATRNIREATPFFEACNLLVRRDALEGSGGFGEPIRMGGEDTWLGWAVLREGWRRAFAPDAVVFHDVTHPGYRWHVHQAWLNGNVSPLVREFPELRREFWRPWAFRSTHPALLLSLFGLALAPRWRAALVLLAPYLYLRVWRVRTRRPDRAWVRDRAVLLLLDAVEVASTIRQSVKHRVVLI